MKIQREEENFEIFVDPIPVENTENEEYFQFYLKILSHIRSIDLNFL